MVFGSLSPDRIHESMPVTISMMVLSTAARKLEPAEKVLKEPPSESASLIWLVPDQGIGPLHSFCSRRMAVPSVAK
jgi:hypothetical protein